MSIDNPAHVPSQNAAPPETGDARGLDQKLRSAFVSSTEKAKTREQDFLQLREGFQNGSYGGAPLEGPAISAMLSLLEHLNWTISIDQITRAMPHFPKQFSLLELRECLARMGYKSEHRNFKPRNTFAKLLPALLVCGEVISVLTANADGKLVAHDPVTGQQRAIKTHKNAVLISFEEEAKQADQPAPRRSWMRRNLGKFRREIFELLGLTTIINMMVLAVSLSVMSIYDKVIPAEAYDTLFAIGIGIAIALCVELVFRNIKARLIGKTSGRLEYLIGTAIFGKLISLPVQMIANTPVGDQVARLRQFETVRDLFSGPFVAVGLELPFVILFTIGLFAIAGPLGYVPLALLVFFILVGVFLVGPIKRQTEEAGRHRREHYQTSLETVSNLRLLRSIGCEDVWLARMREKTAKSAAAKRRANLSQRFLATLSASSVPIAGSSTVAIGALLVMNDRLTVGALIGAMIVIWRILAPIQQMFLMLSRYTEMAQMVTQIDQMMKLPSSVVELDTPIRRMFAGEVSFDRVSFRYQGAVDTTIQGLTAQIKPGELIAIQGHSGSGKTSILRLILDLYRPQVGSVQVDGVNVRQIPATDLRATIGYVPQKPVLFHGTIAQNLRLASPGATDEQLWAACEEVGLLEAIKTQPKGLHTLIDHARNASLPGGFRQSLSIAQALLRSPQILLLDEPAKTLDQPLEEALMASISKRRGKTTIVMVSHRPSHIALADKVLILNRGQMVSFDAPASPQARSA